MTAASVKNPTSLAYRIMTDAKYELQAVEKLQQLSIHQNRQETQRMRQEFSDKNTPSPTEPKSPRPIIKGAPLGPKPAIAPKPKPRVEQPGTTPTSPVKGVRFNLPDTHKMDSVETVRPPPGYGNELEETDSAPATTPQAPATTPQAPPPYHVAVTQRIKHVRQSEIQADDLLPNGLMDTELTGSKERLVDHSPDLAYYENGAFEVSDSEFEQHRASYIQTANSPSMQRNDGPPKPATHPYTQPFANSSNASVADGKTYNTNLSQMDYVNVYEEESSDRYVADINNHYVEDLYPETANQSAGRTVRQTTVGSTNEGWATSGSLPFYMTDSMKASEC